MMTVLVPQHLWCDPDNQLLEDKMNISLSLTGDLLIEDVEELHSGCANALLVFCQILQYHQCRQTPLVTPVATTPWFVGKWLAWMPRQTEGACVCKGLYGCLW